VTLAAHPGDRAFRVVSCQGPGGLALDVLRLRAALSGADIELASVERDLPEHVDRISIARWGHFPALDGRGPAG